MGKFWSFFLHVFSMGATIDARRKRLARKVRRQKVRAHVVAWCSQQIRSNSHSQLQSVPHRRKSPTLGFVLAHSLYVRWYRILVVPHSAFIASPLLSIHRLDTASASQRGGSGSCRWDAVVQLQKVFAQTIIAVCIHKYMCVNISISLSGHSHIIYGFWREHNRSEYIVKYGEYKYFQEMYPKVQINLCTTKFKKKTDSGYCYMCENNFKAKIWLLFSCALRWRTFFCSLVWGLLKQNRQPLDMSV
jgi:hypothetical protein